MVPLEWQPQLGSFRTNGRLYPSEIEHGWTPQSHTNYPYSHSAIQTSYVPDSRTTYIVARRITGAQCTQKGCWVSFLVWSIAIAMACLLSTNVDLTTCHPLAYEFDTGTNIMSTRSVVHIEGGVEGKS